MTTTVYVQGADRMITAAALSAAGVYVRFADERSGVVPFQDLALPGIPVRVLLPSPHTLELHLVEGGAVEVPWDFARHYADETYRNRSREAGTRGRRLFAERLRSLRSQRGVSQEALARAAGLSRASVARMESGAQLPRYSTLQALAAALDIPVERLLASVS